MEEIWKDIEGFEGLYKVSNLGRVINKMGKLKKPYADREGYLDVQLSKEGKKKKCRVHRLVAQAFIPNPDNLPTVNHINEIKDDNRVINLEWMTIRDNVTYSQGYKVNQYSKDGIFIKTFESTREAERELHIGHKEINLCCQHKKGHKSAGGFIWEYCER